MSVFSKNKRMQFIGNMIYTELNDISGTIRQKQLTISEQAAAKGTIHSGMYINEILNLWNNSILESCSKLLNNIDNLQSDWNIKFKNKELEIVRERLSNGYLNLIDSIYIQEYDNKLKNKFINGTNVTGETMFKSLKSNIKNTIDKKIIEIQLKRSIIKEVPTVRQQKISNVFAFIAVLISILSLYFSLR